jgi:CheY-like chemotaxis protein
MPTALIVEDEPEANRLLSRLVQLRGYRTESAYTGGEALSIARDRPPDVVFLDLMLPDTNGYDVCRALKTRRETNPIPVVMVTARLAEENRLRSFQAGASGFIPKPYTPDQIFGALSSVDSWRRANEVPADRGEIPLDARCGAESFERVQRLTGLLLAHTSLDEESVGRIGQALSDIGKAALEWGERHRVGPVATIRYQLHPDRLSLTLDDVGGWFRGGRPALERVGLTVDRAGFDAIEEEPGGEALHLTKRFPSGADGKG